MEQRMGPEQHRRYTLQQRHYMVPANCMSTFMDQNVRQFPLVEGPQRIVRQHYERAKQADHDRSVQANRRCHRR
jgi:hypothetical protein